MRRYLTQILDLKNHSLRGKRQSIATDLLLLRNISDHLFYKHLQKAFCSRTKKSFPNLGILKSLEKKAFRRISKISEELSRVYSFSMIVYHISLLFRNNLYCVKSVRIRGYSGMHFSRIFPAFSTNAGKCEKNADQNNSEYGHFTQCSTKGRGGVAS